MRIAEDGISVGNARQRILFRDQRAVGLPHRDAIAVRGAHHDAFHDRLSTDERLLAAFKYGE